MYYTDSDGEFLILIHVLFIFYYLRLVTQLKDFPHDDGTITDVSTDGEAMKYTPGI